MKQWTIEKPYELDRMNGTRWSEKAVWLYKNLMFWLLTMRRSIEQPNLFSYLLIKVNSRNHEGAHDLTELNQFHGEPAAC
jgi:hypothetical protein